MPITSYDDSGIFFSTFNDVIFSTPIFHKYGQTTETSVSWITSRAVTKIIFRLLNSEWKGKKRAKWTYFLPEAASPPLSDDSMINPTSFGHQCAKVKICLLGPARQIVQILGPTLDKFRRDVFVYRLCSQPQPKQRASSARSLCSAHSPVRAWVEECDNHDHPTRHHKQLPSSARACDCEEQFMKMRQNECGITRKGETGAGDLNKYE